MRCRAPSSPPAATPHPTPVQGSRRGSKAPPPLKNHSRPSADSAPESRLFADRSYLCPFRLFFPAEADAAAAGGDGAAQLPAPQLRVRAAAQQADRGAQGVGELQHRAAEAADDRIIDPEERKRAGEPPVRLRSGQRSAALAQLSVEHDVISFRHTASLLCFTVA